MASLRCCPLLRRTAATVDSLLSPQWSSKWHLSSAVTINDATKPILSATAAGMPRSGIRDVMDAAWELEKSLGPNERLIRLEVGQPNFAPPPAVLEATVHALNDPKLLQYIPNAGNHTLCNTHTLCDALLHVRR